MQKIVNTICWMLAAFSVSFGQNLTQNLRGTILDSDSKSPLIGVQIILLDIEPIIATTTDESGNFRLQNVKIGHHSLQLSLIGYENQTISDVIVDSGKETILLINMQESVFQLREFVIKATEKKGEALNEMALISSRSVSLDQTKRFAGSFNDPSRILSSFAGVSNSQNGDNDIIVRGNSPKYVQWRLEGIEITNPNHFGEQNAVSGGVSTLNNNLLATSDFHAGAFSPEFGDVLSGVYDINLRTGNNEKYESSFGLGLLGTDLMLEGPFKKGYRGSFLLNYRYSTITLIDKIGLIDVGGIPKFQDATIKLVFPTSKVGTFSFFGLGGLSGLLFENVQPQTWETPGNNGQKENIQEDFKKVAGLLNTGLNHILPISDDSFLKTSLSFSTNQSADKVFESFTVPILDENNAFLRDSIVSTRQNFTGDLAKSTYRASMTFNRKIDSKNKVQIGSKYALFDYNYEQSLFRDAENTRFTVIDFRENIGTIRNFVSWKHRFNKDLTLVSGFHNMNVLFNKKSTIEPRIGINWKLDRKNAVHAGYGKHSTMESVHNYFAKIETPEGQIIEPNRDLDLLKADHFVIGYETRFSENLMAKLEVYYQNLYNLPVENLDSSYYSTINEGLEYRYVDLVNKGTGKNYGVELTIERFLHHNFYFLLNGSLFNSTYKSLEGVERNTAFNGQYLVNFLCGKEFVNLGKKRNRSFSLNAKVFFGGGRKYIPLLRDANGNLSVDPDNGQFWDYKKAYENKIEDVFQLTMSASYKINRPKTTHEIYLNIDNVTNTKTKLTEYYDERAPQKVGYVQQFGLFPNLIYRVYF
jgi:CarboxypepD_reg-like domain